MKKILVDLTYIIPNVMAGVTTGCLTDSFNAITRKI